MKSKGGVLSPAVFSQSLSRASTSQIIQGSGGTISRDQENFFFYSCRYNTAFSATYVSIKCDLRSSLGLLSSIFLPVFLFFSEYPISTRLAKTWLFFLGSGSPLTFYSAISYNYITERIGLCYTPSLLCWMIIHLLLLLFWKRNGDDEINPQSCQSRKMMKTPQCTAAA